jgi:hypothetical protein
MDKRIESQPSRLLVAKEDSGATHRKVKGILWQRVIERMRNGSNDSFQLAYACPTGEAVIERATMDDGLLGCVCTHGAYTPRKERLQDEFAQSVEAKGWTCWLLNYRDRFWCDPPQAIQVRCSCKS